MTSPTKDSVPAPWLDKAWLQKVLRDIEKDRSLVLLEHCVKNMGAKGDNYLSVMYRITARLWRSDHDESEMHMIVKKIPPGKEMNKTLMASTAFPNEITMLSKILPQCHEILNKAARKKCSPFAAKYICSEDNDTRFLIAGDLKADGFRMGNRRNGLDMDHCLLLMETLARYHATTVALHEANPSIIESFQDNYMTEESSKHFISNLWKLSIKSVSEMVRSWPECGERLAGKLGMLSSAFHDIVRKQLKPDDDNLLNVLTHGDLWVNNMMFKYDDETGVVRDMRFVDFQNCHYASFAIDLQFFIHTSPSIDVRARHLEDLLTAYHTVLNETLCLLGLDHKTISFKELVEEYEKKYTYGFVMSLLIWPLALANPEDAVDLESLLGGNDDSSGMGSTTTNKEFVKVMRRLLPLYEEKGYF